MKFGQVILNGESASLPVSTDGSKALTTAGGSGDYVLGASNLTTANRMVYVDSAGTVNEDASLTTTGSGSFSVINVGSSSYIVTSVALNSTNHAHFRNGVLVGSVGTGQNVVSGGTNTHFGINAENTLLLAVNTTEAMRIDSSGNVGIGTTSPVCQLVVSDSGTDSRLLIQHSGTGSTIGDGLLIGSIGSNFYVQGYEAWPLIFGTSGTERMRIDSNGNLLVNTTSQVGSEIARFNGDVYSDGFYDCATAKGLKVAGIQVVTNQQAALTAQLTTITHTAPGTPDYAIQNMTNTSPYGFVTQDEANTTLSVIANLQTRVSELETKLQTHGLIA